MYYNGELVDAKAYYPIPDAVYEVIRVRDGVPQFLDEHLKRFEKSWRLSGRSKTRSYLGENSMADVFMQVVKVNDLQNQNVRIDMDSRNLLIRAVESFYPPRSAYQSGVDTGSMMYTRKNPNAKVSNLTLLERVRQFKKIENVFEVILVNNDGQIFEGSKSNIFFLRGSHVFTPSTEYVLEGVTRKAVVDICKNTREITLHIEPILLSEIDTFDACFLTGTSIDLLPIKSIDSQLFDSAENKYYRMLLKRFRELADKQ